MIEARTREGGTNAVFHLGGREQSGGLDDAPFAMDPLWFDGIEPGTLGGEKAGDDANATPAQIDEPIVRAHPASHAMTAMPGGVIPDQEEDTLAACSHLLAEPVQKLLGQCTD